MRGLAFSLDRLVKAGTECPANKKLDECVVKSSLYSQTLSRYFTLQMIFK